MQLNSVVLPAPFGPMTAVISPRRAAKDTASTAVSPPKRIVRLLDVQRSSFGGMARRRGHHQPRPSPTRSPPIARFSPSAIGGRARADQAARPQHHDRPPCAAEDQHPVFRRGRGTPRTRRSSPAPRCATPSWLPSPPSTTIASTIALSMKVKLSGLMKACRVAKNAPAKPPNMAPMREGGQLGDGDVDAK